MADNFFDFREKMVAKRTPQQPVKVEPLTVSQLTARIERAIKSGVPATVYVKGEVSNAKLSEELTRTLDVSAYKGLLQAVSS